jgi:hypothetical protein
MDEEKKKAWIEALRGGGYKQGKGKLRRGDAFCCLGVLVDVCGDGHWEQIYWDYFYRYAPNVHFSTMLDSAACHQYGIPCEIAKRLAMMNDEGKSFDEIADYVEEHL